MVQIKKIRIFFCLPVKYYNQRKNVSTKLNIQTLLKQTKSLLRVNRLI